MHLSFGIQRHYVVIPSLGLAYGRVPKAANSTIKRLLARTANLDHHFNGVGYGKDRNWRAMAPEAHFLSARALRRAYPEIFVFSFVREPLARLASCYRSKIVKPAVTPRGFRREGLTKGVSFRDFAEHVARRSDSRSNIHYRAQSAILTRGGALVPDFIGRYESLSEDWDRLREEVAARTGAKLLPMPARSAPPGRPPPAAPGDGFDGDEALMLRLKRRYAEDYRLFYPERAPPA